MAIVASTVLALHSPEGRIAVMACDGQATMESRVVKRSARKIHRLHGGRVLAGFSGGTADGTALLERLEAKLAGGGSLRQAGVELAREWRTDRALRRVEVALVAVSPEGVFLVTGEGDVIEPDDGLVGIGSGGGYAVSAAKALLRHARLPLPEVAREALRIAAEIDVYTNDCVSLETLTW